MVDSFIQMKANTIISKVITSLSATRIITAGFEFFSLYWH